MAQNKHILIVCGEASGDMHAAELAHQLNALEPGIKITAVGGEGLRREGARIICDIKELSVFGVFDALKKLPKFLGLKKLILNEIKAGPPDALILVDFSGFNLRLAKSLNNAIPVIYYVSPQVWASRKGRVKTIKKYVKELLVLFKFEEEFYREYGIKARWVGHPLLDMVKPSMEKSGFLKKYNFYESRPVIALLPGSRRAEVKLILPVMLKTARMLNRRIEKLQFVVAKSPNVDWDLYSALTRFTTLDLKIIESKTYDCINIADFCMVCSGTATLETAIMQKPFVTIYKTGLLNYLFYLPQVKVPYIGIVNIIAGRKIIPEFIQFTANPKKITEEVYSLLSEPRETQNMQQQLCTIRSYLGESGASLRAARRITASLNK